MYRAGVGMNIVLIHISNIYYKLYILHTHVQFKFTYLMQPRPTETRNYIKYQIWYFFSLINKQRVLPNSQRLGISWYE